jgi:hypothetical protein
LEPFKGPVEVRFLGTFKGLTMEKNLDPFKPIFQETSCHCSSLFNLKDLGLCTFLHFFTKCPYYGKFYI